MALTVMSWVGSGALSARFAPRPQREHLQRPRRDANQRSLLRDQSRNTVHIPFAYPAHLYSYGAEPPVAVADHRIEAPGAWGAATSGVRETVVDSGGGAVDDDGTLIFSV